MALNYIQDLRVPASPVFTRSALHSAARGDLVVPRMVPDDVSFCIAGPEAWNSLPHHINIVIIIISGFGIYGAAVVPVSRVGNTWQRLTLVLHEFLSNRLTPSRLHIVISFLTHANHVFLGLPRSLVPGSPNRVMELMYMDLYSASSRSASNVLLFPVSRC